jgi:hypothetical protein
MILTLLLLLTGGCQLAVADGINAQSQDMLCGVFVTLKPIEPAPAETVIDLPVNWNGNIEDVLFNEEDSRIYATRHEVANGGVDYTFDGINGFRLFSITEMNPNGNDNYQATFSDSQWEDVSSSYTATDNGSDIRLTGTLCFDVHFSCRVYTNPVYQTADGRVYCTYGNSHFYDLPDKQPGEWGSTTICETTTQTVNGEASSHNLEAAVNLAGINTNKRIVLKQMNIEDNVIQQTDFTQGDIPGSLRVLPDTEYMILEEHSIDFENKAAVSRTMIKTDEEILGARFTGENGIVQSYPIMLTH